MGRDPHTGKIIYDTTGPAGNSFAILGTIERTGKELSWDKAKIESVMAEAKSGDYTTLIDTFEKYFGELYLIIRPEPEDDDDYDDTVYDDEDDYTDASS